MTTESDSTYKRPLEPKESAAFIVENAKDVAVDMRGVRSLARHIYDDTVHKPYNTKAWKTHALNPKEMTEATVEWIFVADLLNFSFWSSSYQVEYDSQIHQGYWALCASLNRALKAGVPITTAGFYATISKKELNDVFRGHKGSEIPLLDERLDNLQQAGQKLVQKYDGKFSNCLLRGENDVEKLLRLITDEFPSFRDEAIYENTRVSFYKRAQILIADLWACFEGETFGKFHNIDRVTAFADYRVPQVLAHFGAIRYSEALNEVLRREVLLENEQREVCEIRAATILACERVRDILQSEFGSEMNAILVDYYLWDYRRAHAKEIDATTPYHRVRCIYY